MIQPLENIDIGEGKIKLKSSLFNKENARDITMIVNLCKAVTKYGLFSVA